MNIPVFRIRNIEMAEKTVNRNFIMVANFLPLDTDCGEVVDFLSGAGTSSMARNPELSSNQELETQESRR